MKYGLVCMGKVRVFAKTKEVTIKKKKVKITDYWFNVGRKNADGEWENKSMNLFFRKDEPKPDHNTLIIIVKAFPIVTGTGDWERIALFVDEWEYADE